MNTRLARLFFAVLASLATYQIANAADEICKIGSNGVVTFSKDTRTIPYKRIFLDGAWSADEESLQDNRRYPIMELSTSSGKFDTAGFYVSSYLAGDGFQANLVRTRDPLVFGLNGIRWGTPTIYSPRNKYLEKYSSKDVSYYISFADNETCKDNHDLSVLVYRGGRQVETILFHVKDMSDAKDFWPEQRAIKDGGPSDCDRLLLVKEIPFNG